MPVPPNNASPEIPDYGTPEEGKELMEIARWIENYRRENAIPKTQFCKKYAGLGSDSTLGKILAGKLSELKVSDWLEKYRGVKATLEIIRGKGRRQEIIYDDLSMAVNLENAYMEVSGEASVARFAIGLANSGCGKTSAIRALMNRYAEGVKFIEANEIWADKPARMLRDILMAFGTEQPPRQSDVLFDLVIKKLREQAEICVVIDEAHHMGPKCLNTIKTMINQTHASFIALALPTLWNRLTREAYQEVLQLTGNRLQTRFTGVLELGDVRLLVMRGVKWENGDEDVKKVAPLLMEKAAGRGNLAFVRAVVSSIQRRADGNPATLADYSAAVAEKEAQR